MHTILVSEFSTPTPFPPRPISSGIQNPLPACVHHPSARGGSYLRRKNLRRIRFSNQPTVRRPRSCGSVAFDYRRRRPYPRRRRRKLAANPPHPLSRRFRCSGTFARRAKTRQGRRRCVELSRTETSASPSLLGPFQYLTVRAGCPRAGSKGVTGCGAPPSAVPPGTLSVSRSFSLPQASPFPGRVSGHRDYAVSPSVARPRGWSERTPSLLSHPPAGSTAARPLAVALPGCTSTPVETTERHKQPI